MPSIQDSLNVFAGTTGLSAQDAAAALANLPLPGNVEDADNSLVTETTKGADVIGSDILTNGTIEAWTYVPAYLTGGNAATAVIGTWQAVADGTFAITIDGVARNVTGLNFSAAADMAAVAAIIQAGIRTLTTKLETCVWSTNHFVISSVDTTASSAITVTSATGSGTDISGAGATAFMDAENAVGTVTNAVGSPDSWSIIDASGTGGTAVREASIKHAGSYSIKFTTDGEGDAKAIEQIETSLTVGAYYLLQGYGYIGAGESCSLLAFDDTFATATQVYNFVTGEWDAIAEIGADHNLYINSGTAEWTEDSAVIPVPASGKINVAGAPNGISTTAYIDDVTLKPYTYADAKDLFTFTNTTDATNLDDGDTVFKFVTTGGTDKTHFEMDGEGSFDTDYTDFDFSSKPVKVANPTDPEHAVNGTSAKVLLGVSDSVNLKSTEATTLNFSLPTGYKIINPEVVIEVIAADTLTGDSQFGVGTNSTDYNNIFVDLGGGGIPTGPGQQRAWSVLGSTNGICSTAGEVFVKITGVDSGTSGTAKFYLYGTLIATS